MNGRIPVDESLLKVTAYNNNLADYEFRKILIIDIF